DDGVGSALARQLAARLVADALLILDAGHAPENILGPVVRFRPDAILFLDAARGGGAPGEIVWLLPAEADGRGGSTHALSLEMLADYLTAETGAVVRVLGIEPASSCSAGWQPASWPAEFPFGEGLSPAVAAAADEVATMLTASVILAA
ncbi:MAG: hydrogenase maturation protease, partial [Candidatus Promineofilum sp.]|nr:hydrogenase maturation protease [Promineifilum sp.]